MLADAYPIQDAEDGFWILGDGRTVAIVAPACGSTGFAPLTVTTDFGSDTEANGFNYTTISAPPTIAGITGNSGAAGTVFQVTGTNFDKGLPLTIEVGGTSAAAVLRTDMATLDVTAPAGSPGWAAITVCNSYGCASRAEGFQYLAGATFMRGDANADLKLDLADGIAILNDLFLGVPAKAACRDALDVDDNGDVDLTDAIRVLNHLFLGGPAPASPYPEAGTDPTSDGLPSC